MKNGEIEVTWTEPATYAWFVGNDQFMVDKCIPRRYDRRAKFHRLSQGSALIECRDGAVFAVPDICGEW